MLQKLRDTIIYYDHVAWYYLNTQWHNSFLDAFIPFLRNPMFWVPLYFFLALFMPMQFRRKGFIWCGFFLLAFVISDQVSASLLKPFFHRLRPCQNPYLTDIIHRLVDCGGKFGFPSSHASNHFAIGIFMAATLGKLAKWVWPVAVIWALSVSFAQVYVGVHYPLDVTCGGLLGTIIGLGTGRIFNRYYDFSQATGNESRVESKVVRDHDFTS